MLTNISLIWLTDILKISFKDIKGFVKWEANSQGELFAHAYEDIADQFFIEAYPLSVSIYKFEELEYWWYMAAFAISNDDLLHCC